MEYLSFALEAKRKKNTMNERNVNIPYLTWIN